MRRAWPCLSVRGDPGRLAAAGGRQLADIGLSRGDIEGLRAIAVVIVVLFHARLGPFEGGFIGVDVFFVVSGFLITSLLLREAEATGKISLAAFWARRARRLLPASLVVIVATLIAARVLLNPLDQRDITDDAFAATFFAVNFVFGFLRVGYFASQQTPSPLLHYWSLAVEEQYYLLWPALAALLATDWASNPTLARALREVLVGLACEYLLGEGDGRSQDRVANFHLTNGARVERLNWLANPAPGALRESGGLMVNYRYEIRDIEKNHEAFANEGTVAAARSVRALIKAPPKAKDPALKGPVLALPLPRGRRSGGQSDT